MADNDGGSLTTSAFVQNEVFTLFADWVELGDTSVFPGKPNAPFSIGNGGGIFSRLYEYEILDRYTAGAYAVLVHHRQRDADEKCPLALVKLGKGPTPRTFVAQPMKLVPLGIEMADGGIEVEMRAFREDSAFFPLGQLKDLDPDWDLVAALGNPDPYKQKGVAADLDWKAGLRIPTRLHGHVRMRKGMPLVIVDKRAVPQADWPYFFRVKDGGFGYGEFCQLEAMKAEPVATLDEAWMQPVAFDAEAERKWNDMLYKRQVDAWKVEQAQDSSGF